MHADQAELGWILPDNCQFLLGLVGWRMRWNISTTWKMRGRGDMAHIWGKAGRVGFGWGGWLLGLLFLMQLPGVTGSARAQHLEPTEVLASHLLVVYNSEYPGSQALAEEYALLRGIPKQRIFGVKGGNREEISRDHYEKFIRSPLLRHVQREGWLTAEANDAGTPITVKNDIWIMVLMRGMPLRIKGSAVPLGAGSTDLVRQGTVAAVDSELACLPIFDYSTQGALNNPFFRHTTSMDSRTSLRMVLVSRLDAPEPEQVQRMMRDAVEVEAYGLSGRAYIDARGLKQGGYLIGDEWMRGAYDQLWDAGFEVEKDERPEVFGKSYPMTDAAFYLGWYGDPSGPFVREGGFRMRRGAVGYHIISHSANTIRPPFESRTSWVIKLIESGVAVTMGAVSEPFLNMTTMLDVFTERLLAGFTFVEAAYQATPTLSWQMTMIGDPLYRPFGVDANRQLAIAKASGLDVTWPAIRNLNLLFRSGRVEEGLALCRQLEREAEGVAQLIYQEKAAQFLMEMQRNEQAEQAWRALAEQSAYPDLARRAHLRLCDMAQAHGDDRARYEAMDAYMLRFPEDDLGDAWLGRLLDLAKKYGTPARQAYYRARTEASR